MTRYRVRLEFDHGFSVEHEIRKLLRQHREQEPDPRPLMPGERYQSVVDNHVPEQLSTADGAVADWVANSASLRDFDRLKRIVSRYPDLDAFVAEPLPVEQARAIVASLREGKAVATSLVVRYACHLIAQETT